MELTNEFIVERSLGETWQILNDLEFIAPCMPGAQLTGVEGDEYRGQVKIKVGPISANYKGKARFITQDEANGKAVLRAEGRDPRQGNANALVTATMNALSATETNVKVHTELSLSGKIASFGRGAIEDVSKKILLQFTENLRNKLGESRTEPAATATSAPSATPGLRTIHSPEAEPLDILAIGKDSMTLAQKVIPLVGVVLGLILLRVLFRGRSSS